MSMARVFCFFGWGLRCFGSHRKHGLHAANMRNNDQGLSAMETIRFTASSLPLMCRFSDAGMTRLSTRCGGRRPKSAKARSRGKYGTRQCSECYGDRMLVAISMVDAAPARGDVHARMHVSPGECNGHLGGHTEFINGRLVN